MHTAKDPSTRLRLAQDEIDFSATLSRIGYFEKNPALAVAVSGGADSMALLLLADEWARANGGRAIALTVDHGLRKESAAEARQVGKWCKARGIEHHILRWKTKKPRSAIQAKAREARYALLTGWCRKNKILHLLTAHHLNDQAETLLLRLSRGSFIEGLAAIPAVSTRGGVRLLRPLLGVPKASLASLLAAKRQPWIEDPSNLNRRYARNAIRPHISESCAKQAGDLARRLGAIRRELEHALAKVMVRAVNIYPDHAVLKMDAFEKLPQDQAIRLLSAMLSTLAGLPMPPRTEQVALLRKDLLSGIKRRALAGCHFHHRPETGGFQVEFAHAHPHMRSAKPLAGAAFLGLNTRQGNEET